MQAIAGVWLRSSSQQRGEAAGLCQCLLEDMAAGGSESRLSTPGPDLALGQRSLQSKAFQASHPVDEWTSDGALVADLRIDNREELISLLPAPPQLAHSISDEALLARCLHTWGTECLDRLVGGFAFAWWDAGKRRLLLARDHTGEKPLFFCRADHRFAFASMPRPLTRITGTAELDESRLADFLAVIPEQGSRTLYRHIERLLPGECAVVTLAHVAIRRYWHPTCGKPVRYKRSDEYVEDFRERFDRAVNARLRSESAIGSHLSGGLDSSSVTATAARLLSLQNKSLTAFTSVPGSTSAPSGLAGRFSDEGPAAAQVAALYPNITHRLVSGRPEELIPAIDRGGRLSDQPVFNPVNQLWLDEILSQARDAGIGVMLQGVGGNLTISLAGIIALADMLRGGRWARLIGTVRELRANGHTSWRSGLTWAFGPALPLSVRRLLHPELDLFSFGFSPVNPGLAARYRLRTRALAEFYRGDGSSRSALDKLYEYYDPGVFNMAAAAGWSIEYRDPTQDKRIYEFCYNIPIEQYLEGGQTRSLIRRAMRGRLPEETLRRTSRGLQGGDWVEILGSQRGALMRELGRMEGSPLARRILDLPRLRRLLETWPASGWHLPGIYDSYHLALSRGLSAGHFLVQHDPEYRDAG